MSFDEEIIDEIFQKGNQEEDNSFGIISKELETAMSELFRKVKDKI